MTPLEKKLYDQLTIAAKTFDRYVKLHSDKGTPDGDQKALTNKELADECYKVLSLVEPPVQVNDEVVMTKVESSNVQAVGWNDGILFVQFKNDSIYQYDNVPEDEFQGLVNAESVGRYLNTNIKGNYNYTKVA